MLSRIIIGILFAASCAAIGRGIVFAFGLDLKVARLINITATSANLTAIAWLLAGIVGLGGLILWQVFHVSDQLKSIASQPVSPKPDLTGSIPQFFSGGFIPDGPKEVTATFIVVVTNRGAMPSAAVNWHVTAKHGTDLYEGKVRAFKGNLTLEVEPRKNGSAQTQTYSEEDQIFNKTASDTYPRGRNDPRYSFY